MNSNALIQNTNQKFEGIKYAIDYKYSENRNRV